MALDRYLEELITSTRAALQSRAAINNLLPSDGCSNPKARAIPPHSSENIVPAVMTRADASSDVRRADTGIRAQISDAHEGRAIWMESASTLETVKDRGESILEQRPQSHRVTIHKPAKPSAPARAWEECFQLAEGQYKPFQDRLGKSYRIAVQVRALALYTNPHAQPQAILPVFVPSIAALAHDLGWSESYVFRILAGKTPGSTRTQYRVKRGRKWREESKNADLERVMTWRAWLTDWACKMAAPSKRFPEGGRRTVKGGTVFYTRPQPSSDGVPKAVPAEWLAKPWRDLEADAGSGRTARAVRSSAARENSSSVSKGTAEKGNGGLVKEYCYSSLTRFATASPGVVMDAELDSSGEIYAVLDVLSSDVGKGHDARGDYVDGLAKRICYLLRDSRSLAFWRKTIWTLLKARIHGVTGALEIVHGALWEVLVVSGDNTLVRCPGALAVALLRRNGWLEVEEAVAGLHAGRGVRA